MRMVWLGRKTAQPRQRRPAKAEPLPRGIGKHALQAWVEITRAPEGSFVVSELAQVLPAWMHFAPQRDVDAVLGPYVDTLLRQGLPFLEALAKAAQQPR